MNYRIISALAAIGIILLIALYAKESEHFNRTLDAGLLVRNSVLTGLAAGTAAGLFAVRRSKSQEDRLPVFLLCFFFCALFAPLLGGMSNRVFAGEAVPVSVEVHLEEAFSKPRFGLLKSEKTPASGYHSFFYLDGRLRKIQSNTPVFSGKRRGDTVQLPFKKGLWGFDFVPL